MVAITYLSPKSRHDTVAGCAVQMRGALIETVVTNVKILVLSRRAAWLLLHAKPQRLALPTYARTTTGRGHKRRVKHRQQDRSHCHNMGTTSARGSSREPSPQPRRHTPAQCARAQIPEAYHCFAAVYTPHETPSASTARIGMQAREFRLAKNSRTSPAQHTTDPQRGPLHAVPRA